MVTVLDNTREIPLSFARCEDSILVMEENVFFILKYLGIKGLISNLLSNDSKIHIGKHIDKNENMGQI